VAQSAGLGRFATGLRSCATEDTFERAAQLAPALGISRISESTRLDRLGLPVYVSVRPRGASLRVHAGKGLNESDARTGALMEALEYAVAERAGPLANVSTLTLHDLVAQWPEGVIPDDFAPAHGVPIDPEREFAAVECEWVGTPETVWLPAELVHYPWPALDGSALFVPSTNGLASGNTIDEATLHALFELLERDATAMNRGADRSALLMPESLPAPWPEWVSNWSAMGIDLIVRSLPSVGGFACFEACLHDRYSLDVNLAAGAGLHADRAIALARAISEAAQSRLSTIHGGRDDIDRFFAKYKGVDAAARLAEEARLLEALRDPRRAVRYEDVPDSRFNTPTAALESARRRLAAAGFERVLRCNLMPKGLGLEDRGVQVVKLVVPGLESLDGHNRRIGRRLRARVLGLALDEA
jgi:ribosomal protein S12 methylthiotransferase accessory factor